MSERNRPAREPQAEADGVIEGRNAVTEALRTGTVIDKIFILKGRPTPPSATSPPPPGPAASWWWMRTSASWTA